MNRIDQLIDQLEDMSSNDTLMDKIVHWACALSAVACLLIVVTGN